MMKQLFIADTHFSHTNIIRFCNRPFNTVEEMNETMIRKWNNVVGEQDLVYHLGDFGFGNLELILRRLNGKKILITGSHDKNIIKYKNYFELITPMLEIKFSKIPITLCHYCMRTWPKSHYNSWHLFGHSHGTLKAIGKSYDVGVDNNNFTPITLDQIAKIMELKPDNFNFVGRGQV